MENSELEKEIIRHRELYWNNTPEISDEEYDKLLLKLNPTSNLLNNIEHNENAELKIKHNDPMLSLDKVFDYKSILDWALKFCRNREEFLFITPKYDGISSRFYPKYNILATRGNGEFGEDISDKLPLIEFLLDSKTEDEDKPYYNGEILVKNSEFKIIQDTFLRKDGKKYSTSRNFVGGILNSKNIDNKNIKLYFVEHKYIAILLKLSEFTEEKWNDCIQHINEISPDFPKDGIVIEILDEEYAKSLGVTSHHPRGKIAYKFEQESKLSKIVEVKFSCGKRKITPVAIIEPIEINNVKIKRVTLHNAKMLLDNNIHINDIVRVVRSGDVIPYITEIKPGENREVIRINNCPSCKYPVTYREPDLYCTNPNCDGSGSKLLFQATKILGIDNIGPTTIDKMIQNFNIESIIDVLELTEDDLIFVPGFGDKMAAKIYNNIQEVLNKPIDDFKILACLNIKGFGETICKTILEKYSLDDIIYAVSIENNDDLFEKNLINIFGLGENRINEFINGLIDNYEILIALTEKFKTILNYKDQINNNSSKGTICFTGKFDYNKNYYYQLAKQANYEIVESVSKDTTYVVSAGPATSKLSKARKHNIKILNIEEFLKLIKK